MGVSLELSLVVSELWAKRGKNSSQNSIIGHGETLDLKIIVTYEQQGIYHDRLHGT